MLQPQFEVIFFKSTFGLHVILSFVDVMKVCISLRTHKLLIDYTLTYSLSHSHTRAPTDSHPEIFSWAGRMADLEAIHNLLLIIRIMLQKSCRKHNCNTKLSPSAFTYI